MLQCHQTSSSAVCNGYVKYVHKQELLNLLLFVVVLKQITVAALSLVKRSIGKRQPHIGGIYYIFLSGTSYKCTR